MKLEIQLKNANSSNPFITFDSDGVGLSRIYDEIWDFNSLGQNVKKVRFSRIDKKHRVNVQECIAKLLEFQKSEQYTDDNHVSVSALMTSVVAAQTLVTNWGKSEFSLLSSADEWRDAKRALKGKYSKGYLAGISSFINLLTRVGIAERHVSLKEMYRLANASEQEQAIAMPLNIQSQVIQKVVNTVETYHAFRTDISEVMRELIAFRDDQLSIELKKRGQDKLSVNEVKIFSSKILRQGKRLVKARGIPNFTATIEGNPTKSIIIDCFIAILLFSGARKKEALSMNLDSYDEAGKFPTLRGLTSKGNNGQPIYTTWQTHSIARMALELAYDMTQFSRDIHKSTVQSLLDNRDINKDKYESAMKELCSSFISVDMKLTHYGKSQERYSLSIDNGLNLKSFSIEANEEDVREFDFLNPARKGQLEVGGTLSKLSPHDFRRSFAVFLIRNRLGNLQTIKYQFKHKNLPMSAWYANYADLIRTEDILLDSQLMALCDVAMEDAAVDAFDEIYNKSEVLSGLEGQRISLKKKEALRKGEQIYMSREELHRLVAGGEKAIVILPTGAYCTNSSCERLCSINYFPTEDKPCDHQIITDRGAKIQARERDNLIQSFRGMNEFDDYAYASILAGLKESILYIEKTLTTHNINFERFTDNIKAVVA